MKLVIIGCGRSGTMFMSKHLIRLGWKIRHQEWGEDGTVDWQMTTEDLSGHLVLHQVRHPLDVIASLATIHPTSWEYIYKHITHPFIIPKRDSLLLRCIKYWVQWNKIAEGKSLLTYRVEDVQSGVSNSTNSRKHGQLSWDDLFTENNTWAIRVKNLAGKYGYNV